MKTGARDNSAAFRSKGLREISPASRSGRGGLIGGRSRRSGRSSGGRARSAKMRGRGTRGTRGGTRATERAAGSGDARRRSSMRDGGDRGRAGAAPVPARAPSVTPPPAQKSTSPCQRVGRVRKNGVRSVRRDGETFTTRPSTGRFGWMFARHTSDASTDARFAIDARRLPSATRGLRRSRGETFATNLRCLFPAESASRRRAVSAPASERRGRVRSRVHARDGRRLAYLRDTRARAFPRSPPGVGTRCVVPAQRARTQVTGWFGSLRGRSPRTH